MWPAIAAIGGAALEVFGARNANRENRLQQEKFASQGIRMRVEDARAAGLHPLFALGGSVPSYSPSAQNIFQGQGQNIARAASQFSDYERELRAAQLEAVRAGTARDMAQAAAFASEAKRSQQEQLVSKPVAESFPVPFPDPPNIGPEFRNPDGTWTSFRADMMDQEMRRPRVPQYLNPEGPRFAFRQWNVPGLGEVILPDASNFSEALEALENPINQSAVLAANVVHYGPSARKRLESYLKSRGMWKLFSDPGGAVGDSIRSFGQRRSRYQE